MRIKCDIHDDHRDVTVKGYEVFDLKIITNIGYWNKHLCHLIQVKNVFVAVNYSIFKFAVRDKIKFSLSPKLMHTAPLSIVYEGLFAQYKFYKYLSSYRNNFFRYKLYKRGEVDVRKLHDGSGDTPFSRCTVIVLLKYASIENHQTNTTFVQISTNHSQDISTLDLDLCIYWRLTEQAAAISHNYLLKSKVVQQQHNH
ncbi:hypothetical protein LINGRAHAP2_LOCUS4301 [Linum grandiflorum]